MTITKVKNFVKKHKKKLLIAAGGAAVLGAVTYGVVRRSKRVSYTELECPKLEQGNLNWLVREDSGEYAGCLTSGISEVPVAQLGKVGEKLCEVDGVEQDSLCNILIGINPKK